MILLANLYDEIDLAWLWSGDFNLSVDGDLEDTANDTLLSLRQEIQTVVASELNDWELYPGYAATLSDFVGEPNNQDTAAAIHDRIRIALTANGVVVESDLKIKVIPVHRHKVLITIRVSAIPTVYNKLSQDGYVTAIVFDYQEQGIFFLDKVPNLIGG